MAEYIDRDELLKELCTVSAPTPSESWIVEKCIEKVNEQPTADVAPKSEVEKKKLEIWRLQGEVERLRKALDEYEETSGLKQAKAEVARQRMNEKMGKHTHLPVKEYVQRIMREIEKEFTEESK